MARSLFLVTLAAAALATPLGSGATTAPLPGNGRIAFAASTGIASMNADGTGQWGVELNVGDAQPAWSRDGSELAVVTHWAGRNGILAMQPNGSLPHLLTTDPADNGPAWSPSGTQLAFVNGGSLLLVNADGGGRHVIWSLPNAYLGRPTWSPDGTSIAFRANSNDLATSGIDILDVAKGAATTVVTDEQLAYPHAPAWSPDGTRIAFGVGSLIYTMTPDGKNLTQLTSGAPGYADEPAWSPDGQQIAFDQSSQIWLMRADGSAARSLTSGDSSSPAWQPLAPAPAGCSLWGTNGNDLLVGTDSPDVICGGAGDDTLIGLGGNDVLRGGDGSDAIAGGTGLDYLDGASGDDTLDGRDGGNADTLDGGPGRDGGAIDGKIDRMGSIEQPRVDADLAAWQPTTASNFAATNPPVRAVDGDLKDWWNSGNYPAQWLEVDLQAPRRIGKVRMIAMDYPSGGSVLLLGRTRPDEPYHLLHAFRGPMADLQLLAFAPKTPWRRIRYLKLYVPSAASGGVGWVAWHELSVYAPKAKPPKH